jgi:Ran GTPase-activating protein (RanGAP) involved in mRNA processing and transport
MGNTELREVYLYNNQIEDEGMEEFARCLENKRGLFAVGLEFNKIGAEGVSKVLMAVKKLKGFERLFLNANDIRGSAQLGNAFIECFSQCEGLKEVRLSNNKLGDEGGIPLAKALRLSKSVKVCHVSNNKLSADSAKELAETLK